MANWKVTKTTKHGKPIEEYTAKIGKDQWKIDSMPHIGPNFGSLYRWDDLRGLRQISTGNIEMLKQQAEGISTKKDAVSDLLRGFSRPGAKARFKVEDRFYFGKGRKERFWASGYDNAKERVRRSAELGKYAKIIMQPEFDSADHWDWVSTASIGEIVNWAKSIARNI